MLYQDLYRQLYMYACNNDTTMLPILRTQLRTIFDPDCSEWQHTTIGEKIGFLRKVKMCGIEIETLMESYQTMWREHNRPDIAVVAPDAIDLILRTKGQGQEIRAQ
jgi:hypothetical protein